MDIHAYMCSRIPLLGWWLWLYMSPQSTWHFQWIFFKHLCFRNWLLLVTTIISSVFLFIQYLSILAFIKHLFFCESVKLKRGWSGLSLNTKYGEEEFFFWNLLEVHQWQKRSLRTIKRSRGPSQNIWQNKHTWHAIWNEKKKKKRKSRYWQKALNALLSAWDLHLIGGNTSRRWSHGGYKLVISLCGCQSAALKKGRDDKHATNTGSSPVSAKSAPARKREEQKESKGTGTLKHGALKCLPLRHNVGIMHGEASCYVKIILDGSLWGFNCL